MRSLDDIVFGRLQGDRFFWSEPLLLWFLGCVRHIGDYAVDEEM